ncbi:hypothetical protein C8J55DRAFT_304410 [Lentinula edodes]|uniref:Uncharacterized protein n=1 Tax=Lentinula lateritia TaxID=40482 RepID=A0A9W9DXE3_9AGAR|nr:hypothetical protein C8J55DRAFT_304410 [Lentinula edodes]
MVAINSFILFTLQASKGYTASLDSGCLQRGFFNKELTELQQHSLVRTFVCSSRVQFFSFYLYSARVNLRLNQHDNYRTKDIESLFCVRGKYHDIQFISNLRLVVPMN